MRSTKRSCVPCWAVSSWVLQASLGRLRVLVFDGVWRSQFNRSAIQWFCDSINSVLFLDVFSSFWWSWSWNISTANASKTPNTTLIDHENESEPRAAGQQVRCTKRLRQKTPIWVRWIYGFQQTTEIHQSKKETHLAGRPSRNKNWRRTVCFWEATIFASAK